LCAQQVEAEVRPLVGVRALFRLHRVAADQIDPGRRARLHQAVAKVFARLHDLLQGVRFLELGVDLVVPGVHQQRGGPADPENDPGRFALGKRREVAAGRVNERAESRVLRLRRCLGGSLLCQ